MRTCRRKPWEKSDADWIWRRTHDVARWIFYVFSLGIIGVLIYACCVFLLHDSLWNEMRLWMGENNLSPAKFLYFTYAVFLLTTLMHCWGTFEKAKFLPRIQDPHYVQSLLASGRHAASEMEKDESSDDCEQRQNKILAEELRTLVEGLREKLHKGSSIVEYDLLCLKILLVKCASKEEVKAQADSYLVDLEDLADEESHTQTKEEYWDIRYQIESLKEKLSAFNYSSAHNLDEVKADKEERKEKRCAASVLHELRAVVTERLLPTVTENEKLWVEGSAIVNMLRYACLASIPLLLAAGTVPSYADGYPLKLTAPNWAILGVAGALVAVLRALGRTGRLEVGNQLGVREVQRTWWGAGLGLVAGFLVYMLTASKFMQCYMFQNCDLVIDDSFPRYVLLAFLAGYAFERTLDRVRAATGN